MKNIKKTSCALFTAIFVLCMSSISWCNGQETETEGGPMVKREKEALYYVIQGFVGKEWNGSDLYHDPCGWTPIQSVACDIYDGYWYVTTLNIGLIHDNSLSCSPNVQFSPQLFQLRHLKSLSFFNCMSHRGHPVTIATQNWSALSGTLESLEFRSNPGLNGQIPATFGDLMKLQSLVLLENGFSGNVPTNLGNLPNLKRLVLSGNRFTGQVPVNFGALSVLLILDLSRNSLSGTLPFTLGGLKSLLKLDLSHNQFVENIPNQIGNLKNLTLLDLRNNNFSGGLPQPIQELGSLQELVLSRNLIGGDIMRLSWPNLQSLIILDLSNTGLTGEVPESISELKNLRFLGLNDNNLTGELPSKLATLSNISAIYIHGNNLTGELKFSETFYGTMGRLFGAWDNPNLCYQTGVLSTSKVPYGVKACQQEVNLYGKNVDTDSKLGSNQDSQMVASLGNSRNGMNEFWCVYLVKIVMTVVFFNIAM
ncbi:Piriformospora indica-insensitive protein 2 [Heracleum sosnowskyi]|uniref:Piriformospora indica-insensitive protein 2 n=1 Tax=Heracleum sosnowskyi TaxID=360622 RepID=A0AAD8M6X2_9APIA|nr:Piriformospora indica-insensitive protein 2 [Heracleum sosnowskyi]